jgi:predicted PurR-regulated permease PerM
MEIIYFTLVAVLLYLASDWLLNRIESWRGKRFEHRSLIFFVIILLLAVLVFNLLQRQMQPANGPAASDGRMEPGTEQRHAPIR